MTAPRWTGAGVMWIEAENARMQERPVNVPLTAENVADAVECRDDGGRGKTWRRGVDGRWHARGHAACDDATMVALAAEMGTVVTKWRE